MATVTTAAVGPTTVAATPRESWWFPSIALGRVAALRVLAYLFVPIISFFLFIPMYRSAVTGLLQTFLFHPRSCQRI